MDNSQSELDVSELEFEIRQYLDLKTGWDHHRSEHEVLENQNHERMPAHAAEHKTLQMGLELGRIRFHVHPEKKKKEKGTFYNSYKMVPRTPEEMFMLSQLAPACHSQHIRNDYYLNCNVKYDGCTCSNLPHVEVPLTVIPVVNEALHGFPEPEGYSPMQLGYFQFQVPMSGNM